jgi:hypothetical protein
MDLNLRKKPIHCYTGSIAFYGAETGMPRAVDQQHVVLKKDGEDHLDRIVRYEVVLLRVRSRGIPYIKYENGRLTGLVTFCVETSFYNKFLKKR